MALPQSGRRAAVPPVTARHVARVSGRWVPRVTLPQERCWLSPFLQELV